MRDVILHPYRYGCFVARTRQGGMVVVGDNIPGHEIEDFEFMKKMVMRREVEDKERRKREEQERRSVERERERRREGLRRQDLLRREWDDKKEQVRRQVGDYKLRVSLSFSITGAGVGIGKMLG